MWISRPLGFFLLFGVGFLLDIVALALADWLLPGFSIDGIFTMIVASIVITAFNVIISGLLNIADEDSYYRKRTLAKAAENPFPTTAADGRNLMMVEIDGLSYHHVRKALRDGLVLEAEAVEQSTT